MGGKVFSTGARALCTPRMIPEIYRLASGRVMNALRPLFPKVQTPIEAPEKTSHGDLDILLSLEGAAFPQVEIDDPQKSAVWAAIAKQIGSVRAGTEQSSSASNCDHSFAIPWPHGVQDAVWTHQLAFTKQQAAQREESKGGANEKADEKAAITADIQSWFVQVDVHLCPHNRDLDWRCFKHDHGDMWSVLGSMIYDFGLTAGEDGLYYRIPEIEYLDKKKARVFLTNSPAETLQFLISDNQNEWYERFPTVDAMFAYAARCRWYRHWLAYSTKSAILGRNERKRMQTRPVFARWFGKWLPSQIAASQTMSAPQTTGLLTRDAVRAEVLAAAFAAFPGAEARYVQQAHDWNKSQIRAFVKNTIIKKDLALPESIDSALPPLDEAGSSEDREARWRQTLRQALIQLIVFDSHDLVDGDNRPIIPPRLRDELGALVIDDVKKWIRENWERVGRAAWVAQRAKKGEKREARQRGEEAREPEAAKKDEAALRCG